VVVPHGLAGFALLGADAHELTMGDLHIAVLGNRLSIHVDSPGIGALRGEPLAQRQQRLEVAPAQRLAPQQNPFVRLRTRQKISVVKLYGPFKLLDGFFGLLVTQLVCSAQPGFKGFDIEGVGPGAIEGIPAVVEPDPIGLAERLAGLV
jgi:hypothetical protein